LESQFNTEKGSNILNYTIQYFENGKWKDIERGTSCGANKKHNFKAITTSKCRLLISEANKKPMISEIQIYNK